ncbi:hypothetical protein PG997_008803 [Apiospora hydei]|uniref:Amino acid transporter n=1 Tax=Apiospora hydei TaxID=1337664 RepID=A0ABR1WBV5_9PEZI
MDSSVPLQAIPAHIHRSYSPHLSPSDDVALVRLGKKPVLKRTFGFLTILGFSCTVLITWEGSLISFMAGFLKSGGPSVIVYGFLVVWAGTISVFATLSELVSMAPTSVGQYHWVSMLAPRSSRKFLGYITGWLTIAGWQSALATTTLGIGPLIQSLVLLTRPGYANEMQNWHRVMFSWAGLLLGFALNTIAGSLLAKFEGFILVLHLLGFFAILFPLVFLSDHATPNEVFNSFSDLGGWNRQALSFSVGMTGSVYCFIGGDAAIHMSEEIQNAAVVIPRSLLTGLTINGCLGLGMVLATLFSIRDIDAVLAENAMHPFMAIFHSAVGSTAGAAVLSSLVVVLSFSALIGCMASASRIYWAFARDRALPGWRIWKRVDRRTKIPFNSVVLTTVLTAIYSLIVMGDDAVFTGVTSVTISALFGSYFVAASLLLYCRLSGNIKAPHHEDDLTNTMGQSLTWGPWRLRGWLGIGNNILACTFLLYTFFFSFWPYNSEVTAANFNWSVLSFGLIIIFSLLYYTFWARKDYSGPIIEM